MALERQIARLARILVDSENISFDEAQARLRTLTLEVVVAPEAASPAAHAAILTAVSVASRTFVGGVRVTGSIDQSPNSALPLRAESLAEAAILAGAFGFDGCPSRKIFVGTNEAPAEAWAVSPWWSGWSAGIVKPGEVRWDAGDNPLPGIAAGALAVGAAFDAQRGRYSDVGSEVDLWPVGSGEIAPRFEEVLLPGALRLIGLGNLGQAFLWTLAALPYADPAGVSLVLQDHDKITEENWATSVLVKSEVYGMLKTKVAEQWALDKGFDVRRLDCRLLATDRVDVDNVDNNDPRLALSGVDKIEARKLMAKVGFDCIVDAGLGRTSSDFDKYRVTVFDRVRLIDEHFAGQNDEPAGVAIPNGEAYQRLEEEIGSCGAAQIGGASVAAPYVSALAAAVAISRVIAVASGCECPQNEVGRLSFLAGRRLGPLTKVEGRGIWHAGKPDLRACY
ncbi:MAG: hypothetical protein OXM01_12355 [Gemmatimonadota bacterium]|nr:hypothetical protein [Gemmatimonadota bacterium]